MQVRAYKMLPPVKITLARFILTGGLLLAFFSYYIGKLVMSILPILCVYENLGYNAY